jgi:hypothetical protein
MAAGEIRVGDIGTVFECTVRDQDGKVVDISSASTKQMIFKTASGKTLTKTASLSSSGTDGKMKYVTIAGDLDKAGGWIVQGKVTLPGGTWKTDWSKFDVYGNLS